MSVQLDLTAEEVVPEPPRPAPLDRLNRALFDPEIGGFVGVSDIAACLTPLLSALNWRGEPRQLAEALPHFTDDLTVGGFRHVLANLNYASNATAGRLSDLDHRLLPCMFVPNRGAAMVLLEVEGNAFKVFDGNTGAITTVTDLHRQGTFVTVTNHTAGETDDLAPGSWLGTVIKRFRRLVALMLAITALTSILALAPPLFVMTVYDKAIGAQSMSTLGVLFAAVLFVFAVDTALRVVRARLLAYVAGRIDLILGNATFQQILHLPVAMSEGATIGAQVARLKQFEAVREFFTGPLAGVLLELPFIAMFLIVIAILAGPVAYIPLALVVAFGVLSAVLMPSVRRNIGAASIATTQRQNFLIEMISNLRSVKTCAADDTWRARHRDLSARAVDANFANSRLNALIQTLAQALMMTAGVAVLTYGAQRVLTGHLSVGGLIAVMALSWRVLTPLQVGFLSLPRFEQVYYGLKRLNQLMSLPREREPGIRTAQLRRLNGSVDLARVSHRYGAATRPALLGVNCTIGQGQIAAITGASGSGKSTLLKLIAGLYQPQAGAVLVDGLDIRQIDRGELRDAIAFVPQSGHMFYGSIAQNLRLSNPSASQQDLERVARAANLLDDINALPDGFETWLTDELQHRLPSGFQQRLRLAQAYVKNARIYLLDEPANTLDEESDRAFVKALGNLRGDATIIMATHRPSHIAMADVHIALDDGLVSQIRLPETTPSSSPSASITAPQS